MWSVYLADLIVAIHFSYVGFVVLAVPVILYGGIMKRPWVHNSWFRNIHVVMIAIVVFEALVGITCPLTDWEQALRRSAGGDAYSGTFIGNLLHDWLFFDFEPWVFTIIYTIFGVLVVGLYLVYPPRWLMRQAKA